MLTKNMLTKIAHEIRELERQKEDLETKINNLKNKVKEEMDTLGVDVLVGDDWEISWTPYIMNRFDQSSFKEAHPDLYESYKVAKESRRFTVR